MTAPTVAVVLPVRDGARYLAEAIASILAQGSAIADVVVVDDGSTDDTADVACSFGSPVRVVHQGPLGQAAALNRGVAETDADLVGFCDADDLWTPGRLERQVAALARDREALGVAGGVEQFVSPDSPDVAARVDIGGTTTGLILGALVVRRQVTELLGPFDTQLEIAAGVDWITRARRLALPVISVDDIVLLRRIHGANLGLRRPERHRQELLSIARRDRGRRVRAR